MATSKARKFQYYLGTLKRSKKRPGIKVQKPLSQRLTPKAQRTRLVKVAIRAEKFHSRELAKKYKQIQTLT